MKSECDSFSPSSYSCPVVCTDCSLHSFYSRGIQAGVARFLLFVQVVLFMLFTVGVYSRSLQPGVVRLLFAYTDCSVHALYSRGIKAGGWLGCCFPIQIVLFTHFRVGVYRLGWWQLGWFLPVRVILFIFFAIRFRVYRLGWLCSKLVQLIFSFYTFFVIMVRRVE